MTSPQFDDRFVTRQVQLELEAFGCLGVNKERQAAAAAEAFQIKREAALPADPIDLGRALLNIGCLAAIGGLANEFKDLKTASRVHQMPFDSEDWGKRVWSAVIDAWLRVLCSPVSFDLAVVSERNALLKSHQQELESTYLIRLPQRQRSAAAAELMALSYLMSSAALLCGARPMVVRDGVREVAPTYMRRGALHMHRRRAIACASLGGLMDTEVMVRELYVAAGRISPELAGVTI